MKRPSLAQAQRGVALDEALPRLTPRRSRAGSRKRPAKRRGRAAGARASALLAPGSLSSAERGRLLDGIQRILEGVFTHLPLKRARYGFDPVQRLCILRTQLRELSDDAFHVELADIVTRLRDAHTRYAGPSPLENKVAALPFLVEMIGPADAPVYVATKVGRGLDASFKPGAVLEYWNGVPIDVAVLRHADREVGGRPDSQRAWAVQSLTLRSLQYGPPPDERWVDIGYRPSDSARSSKEIRIEWKVVDPSEVRPMLEGGPTGARGKALRRTRAVDPAAEAIRRAKMLLFAPHALRGRQAPPPPKARARARTAVSEIIPTRLTETLKAMSIQAPGGPFGYLRIYGFDAGPDVFVKELLDLIPALPDRGLIIDIRGNPGGYIWATELALQLFTPKRIEPTRFSALATPFMRQIATIGDVAEDLAPWKVSLDAAVRNGELYAQPIPITEVEACNALGQHYGGPVVLVGDSTTYSAGDLFAAGFVDNGIGPFLCVGSATGAGGANVWPYSELRRALAGSAAALPALPEGIDLSFSFRRATRARASEGLPIEDVGVSGTPYVMTLADLLHGNRDLIATAIGVLKQQPFSRLVLDPQPASRTIRVTTDGLDRLDLYVDGHAAASHRLDARTTFSLTYPAGTRTIEVAGFANKVVRQRRRLTVA